MRKIRGKQIDLYTDSAFILESDELIPSQKATKTFVKGRIINAPDWATPATDKAPSESAVKEYVSTIADSMSTLSEVTYSQVNTQIANNQLKVGSFYKITDYRTTHIIPNTESLNTASVEPLLLLATSPNSFSNVAYSTTYPSDYIEYDFNDNLCEDGTTARTGFITRRIDTAMNLETPYDFRSVKFRRWQADTAAIAWNSTMVYSRRDVVYYTDGFLYISVVDGNTGAFDLAKWGKLMDYTGYVLMDDQIYTTIGNTIIPVTSSFVDSLTFGANCADIRIGKPTNGLNNITFGANCEDILVSPDCENITFNDDCYHIALGAAVVDNHFYTSSNIKVDSGSYSNFFAANSKVTLGMESANNIFCEGVNDIVGGTGSDSIVIYNGSEDIKFGNNCTEILLAGVSSKLSFPTLFQNKTFSNGISGITFVLQDTSVKTYTISGTHNVLVDMKSPNGEMWYRTIEDDGSLSIEVLE